MPFPSALHLQVPFLLQVHFERGDVVRKRSLAAEASEVLFEYGLVVFLS